MHKYTNTQIHKYKVLKRLNMRYIFEKHGIQGYQSFFYIYVMATSFFYIYVNGY